MSEKASQKKGNRSLEEMVGALSAQLDSISKQLSANNEQLAAANRRLDDQADRFVKLEGLLASSQRENAALKVELRIKDDQILEMKTRINAVEQHSRSSCIRIFKLAIDGDERDPVQVAEQVYDTVIAPILQGAVNLKKLRYLPKLEQCIVTAHILPSKDGKTKPILVRLVNAHMRSLIIQLKKDYAPKSLATSPSGSISTKPPPQLYPIFEDMTRDAFQLMRALSSHEKVHSSWCYGGQLRFRLVDSETVLTVKSIYDTVEKIINM